MVIVLELDRAKFGIWTFITRVIVSGKVNIEICK